MKNEEFKIDNDMESPAKEMKGVDFPHVRRSSTLLDNQKLEDLNQSNTEDNDVVMEYRPLVDVYEVESYKDYNRVQYPEVLRYTSHYREGASLRDHAYGIMESGKELVEETCTIF